ncbi:MAG: hypothetical protein ABJC04_09185 [Verrucomicrobiota bacterium]
MVKEPDETVDGIDCFVVSAETDEGKAWLWVGKQDDLVHQSRQSLKEKLREVTDAELETMLAEIPGKPPLPIKEMKRRINDGRKKAATTMKPVTVVFSEKKGVSGLKFVTIHPPGFTVFTQAHTNIVVNQKFSPSDFAR